MNLDPVATPVSRRTAAIVLGCVVVLAAMLVWTFLGMRAVMDVGGTCAEGGPYEIATPCPDGAVLLTVAVPVMLIAAMLGSAVATSASAPDLLLPMWGVLFGTLGWNFLEYGFRSGDGTVWGWIVPGVVFELMALPALYLIARGASFTDFSTPRGRPGPGGRSAWYAAYAVLGATGAALGWWSFDAWS